MSRSQSVNPFESLELLYGIANDVLATFWTGLFPKAGHLTLRQFLDRACPRTKLSNFGADEFLGDLRIFLETVQEESLHQVGRLLFRWMVINCLSRRLFLQKELEFNPCIVNESIRAPIVIVGFPRSGTTLLQNLLGLAPEGTFALAIGGFFSVPDY